MCACDSYTSFVVENIWNLKYLKKEKSHVLVFRFRIHFTAEIYLKITENKKKESEQVHKIISLYI